VIVKKKVKKALIILGSIILVFILVLITAVLLFFYNKPLVKGILEKQLTKRTGIRVMIGKLDYELFPLRVEAEPVAFSTHLEDTEVDVFVEKLVLKGDLHRIRKKQKPYFDSIEGIGVRIHAKVKRTRKKIVIEDIIRGLSSGMDYVRQISLENSILDFVFSDKRINLQGVDFALSPSKEHESFAYTLLFRDAEGQIPFHKIGFHNTIQGSGTLSLKDTPSIDGRFNIKNTHFILDEKKAQFEKIDLNFRGELQTDENILSFPTLEIDVSAYGSLLGSLAVTLKDDLTLKFHPRIQIDDLSRILFLVKDHIPYELGGLEMEGSVLFEGEGELFPKERAQKARVSGKVVINPTRIRYRTSRFSLDHVFAGSLRIHDFPENLNISGKFNISKGSYSQKNLDLKGFTLEIPVEFKRKTSELNISLLKGHFQAVAYHLQKREIEIMEVSFSGKGIFDLQKRKMKLSEANILLPAFPSLQMTAQAGLDPEDSKSISVKCSNIGFKSLLEFFSPYIPPNVKDWEPDGVLSLQIEAHNSFQKKDEIWDVTTRLETSGVQFHDPSFSFAGESLKPNLILKGTFRRSSENIPLSASFDLSQGESLVKDYYINWNEMPIRGNVSGRLQVSERRITDVFMDAFIPNFGKFTGTGIIDAGQPSWIDLIVTASGLNLSSLYSFMVQKRGGSQIPTEIRGDADARIALKGDKNTYSIKGHLRIQDASLASGNKRFSIKGIDAYIPLDYEKNLNGIKYKDVPAEKGFLALIDIHTSLLDLASLKLDLSTQRNRYMIEPLELEIFGGKVFLGRVFLEFGSDLANFSGQTSLFWKEADLSQLPIRSQQFQLKGKFSVDLPHIEIFPDHVSTEGQCEVEAYGGNITANNIQIERPFSQARTISCDVRLTALDLEKITDSIPFGRVTGIINGEIQDLAFSYGQPERFVFQVESEKRKGVAQRFSLKATNDLAIIGTGETTPLSPNSGWTRLIKEFRYDKIGMYCSLKNDMFTLRGTIQRKGNEYLVKGSGLFAINVVNKQPRNQIRFKDMLSRLKRIGRSQKSQ
jgi:hypothetical protein